MSRVINTSVASIQFQVNARQASAAMQALQKKADELSGDITDVNKKIADLGKDVPDDFPELVNYRNILNGLQKDLKDVEKAQRDFLKGAKAADQLWQAATNGNIESLSFRSIKAGINGMKKRQEGLSPGDAQDMKDWRIIKEVIDEADRVMKQAGADVQNVVQTIREGGKVSEQAMRQTISTLRELKGSVDETDAEYRTYGNDLDFMEAKLQEFNEAQRRAKGEIVDANDARREMNKLTEEGAAAAKREAEEAERKIAALHGEREELMAQREQIKQNIAATQEQVDKNHELIEEKHRELEANERAHIIIQDANHAHIEGLKTRAEQERKLANEMSDDAEQQRRVADLQKQTTEQLTEKVTELQGKLAELNAEPVKPKADASELEQIERKLKNIDNLRKQQQEVIDAYEAKYGKTSDEQFDTQDKVRAEAVRKDVAAREAAVDKVNNKWEEFWKKQEAAAQEFARSLGKSLDEISPEDITSEQLSGPLAKSAQAAYKVTARRDYELSEALGREGKLTEYKETARRYEGDDSPEAKVIESLQRKYREYTKELREANAVDTESKRIREEQRKESEAYNSALGQMQGFQKVENDLLQQKEGLLKQSTQKSEQQIQLEGQLADTKEQLRLAQEKQNDEQQEYIKLQGEAIEQGNKAAAAETKLADAQSEATQKQADFNQKQQEGLDAINQVAQDNQALQQSIDGLNGKLEQNSKDIADNANKATEAEQQKQQAQQLTIKRMEEMLSALRKENNEVIPANTEKWRENEAEINRLSGALEKLKETARIDLIKTQGQEALSFFNDKNAAGLTQADTASAAETAEKVKALAAYRDVLPKDTDAAVFERIDEILREQSKLLKETTGEWMSYEDAKELASKAGGEGFIATTQQMQQAVQAMERQRDSLIKTIQLKQKDGKATADEEAKLEILEKELKDLKFEQDNFNMSHEKMQRLLKEPVKADNLDELKAAIKRADGELKRMEGSLGQNNKQYKAFAEQVRNAKNQLKEMEGQAKASATAWEKAWSRLKTYVVMYMGFNAAWNKMTSMAGDLMELSDKMGEVRKTTQLSAEAVAELSKNLAKLDVRTPLEELMAISASAGQLGLKSVEDIQGFTEAANMLMIALPEMGKEAATEMMRVAIATGEVDKIRKQLEEGTVEGSNATAVAMTKIASTIDRLRASSASTAPEITDFVKRLGAVAAQSGISIDQVAALGSTISSLGMRVEMSATALSRMIPAIKNNAFAIANAIGVAPEALRSLFEAGRGMEAILMIFQHLKEQNANADTIENLLGIGNMKDVMKQLNQQGARAGIVFAGLSQNVDELRKQLVIAGDAYERNTAIQDEFNRMNDTTAAKWERLKNTIEEMVVSDWTQRVLGGLIEGVHKIINLLVGNSGLSAVLLTIITLFGVLKLNIMGIMWSALATALVKIVDLFKNWRIALDLLILRMKAMTAAQWANAFIAIAAAVGILIYRLQKLSERAAIVANEMAKANEEILKQTGAVDKLFRRLSKTNAELEKSKTRLEDVTKAGKDATESENALKKASSDHAAAIRDINSKYGAYLGYMLSETSSAKQLARARELINAKLRETITLKQQEAALGSVEQEFGGKVNKRGAGVEKTLETFYGNDYDTAARVSVAISEAAQKYAKNSKEYQEAVKKILADNKIQKDVAESYMGTFEDYREAIEDYQKQMETVNRRFKATNNINRKQTREAVNKDLNAILGDWKDLVSQYRKAEGEEKEKLAAEVYKQQRNYANAVANNAEYFDGDKRKEVYDKNIKNMKTYEKGLRSVAGEAIRTIDAMERAEGKITGLDLSNDGESDKNPWGGGHDAASTDWKNMTANQLVERRKQMKEFVNAIQTDTDVQSVLKEDAALKKAIENGMSSDMRTVIEWYNTERLKIQDELHARHLTNTGDWMDPKKQRGAHKQFRDEMDAYLHELDAYYTERKTRIEEAGTDEGLTEAEIKNRTLNNEMEWQQRRAELQKLYSRKQKEVTEEELDAIYHIIAERTGDSESFVKAQIAKTNQFVDSIEKSGEKGAAIVHRWMSQVELDTERSYLKGQQALTKQIRAIEAIIDKERPFNGITKSLQENLATMDILTGYMRKEYNKLMKQGKDMTDFNNRQAQEELRNTTFMLGEAENAYSTTIGHVMDDMRQKGMTAWADWLSADPKLQEALMAQLRSTYDSIQDAIKKEASQLKKQAEIMWNNILMPDGKTTLKDAADRAIAQLSLNEGRVSRANSLIGAGQASERVADKLAIKQMQLQLTMQEHYYNLMKLRGQAAVDMLNAQAKAARERHDYEEATRKELDAQHAQQALNLATAKEETELAKQREEIVARTEDSQNRLYKELREWASLLSSSIQGVFEASHAGDAEYYNELAKMNLTGKGGPGAGTYIVIDNEGTEDATAHYEYLNQRQALERQHEIEIENARAEAWRKVWDDINMKINDSITDWMNAYLQNQSIDANTAVVDANTLAIKGLTEQLAQGLSVNISTNSGGESPAETPADNGFASDKQAYYGTVSDQNATPGTPTSFESSGDFATDKQMYQASLSGLDPMSVVQPQIDADNLLAQTRLNNQQKVSQGQKTADQQIAKSSQSTFAKMVSATNMYGAAYQAMSNDNLDATQKFQMITLQGIGSMAMAGLEVLKSEMIADAASKTPGVLGKLWSQLGWAAAPVFAIFTGLLGGLMGLATSKVAKSKSQIAQVTGASIGAGRLATGMLTYAEGNVNEFTDPGSLTPGRHYNVDGADGKTYRAKYMGEGAKTHITNGPEFHLVGEAGREAIIDAHTTRNIQMNDPEIWHYIQTLYNGGSLRHTGSRRGRGVRAFADGNMDDFEMADGGGVMTESGFDPAMLQGFQQSLDRNSAIMEQIAANGIEAFVSPYGPRGVVAGYDKAKKEALRHGESYL